MITRDYVLRMISMLVKVLQRVLALKQGHDFRAARKELTGAYRSLLGVNPDFAHTFSDTQLIELFGRDPETRAAKCYVVGVLLKEEAELEYLALRYEAACALCAKALSLLLTAFLERSTLVEPDHERRIASCVALLRDVELPTTLLEKLLAYYEQAGKYEEAEDVVFDLVATNTEYRSMAVSFFERLLKKSDEELQAGGLTREEVHESLAAMRGAASV
jgi:hypothetical protein